MDSKDTPTEQRSAMNIFYRFLGGAAIGALLVIIPTSYGSFDIGPVQIGFASLMVISCGLLGSVLGKKFIDAMLQALESFSP
jgi:hypothetical protein